MTLTTTELKRLARQHLWLPYTAWSEHNRWDGPTVLAQGIRTGHLVDTDGRRYLDGIAALEALAAGHGRVELIEAAVEQLRQLAFYDVFRYASEPNIRLAAELARLTPGDLSRVHFTPGGSEADEAAIKMAQQYHQLNGEPGRWKVISRRGAYHGSTFGVMAVDGHTPVAQTQRFPIPTFGRFVSPPYCYDCPLGKEYPGCGIACVEEIATIIEFEGPETVSAVIVDPASTYMGVHPPPPNYLPRLAEICRRYGVLLIADEVLTGFGRTGKWFCVDHWGVVPDIMTVSKALTSGYAPLGAAIATERVAEPFLAEGAPPFANGQTYGGHPVATAVALANLALLERDGLVDRAAQIGPRLLAALRELSTSHRVLADCRGLGLLIGLELCPPDGERRFANPAAAGTLFRHICREEGLLTLSVWPGNVMLIAPSLTVDDAWIDELLTVLDRSLKRFERGIARNGRAGA